MKTKHFLMMLTLAQSLFCLSEAGATATKPSTPLALVTPTSPQSVATVQESLNELSHHKNPFSMALFRPSYVLPYYHTGSPDTRVYTNNTPNNQSIMQNEFKAQISLRVPIIKQLFQPTTSLDIAYTQLSYWQIYAASQYFRETNYEPELFIEHEFTSNVLARAGFDHQSNGRGGMLERSWNRAIGTVQWSGDNWLFAINAWALMFAAQSSAIDNPDIAHFLGYENLLLSYQWHHFRFSAEAQNLESALRRGFVQATLSYPILDTVSLYIQVFNGYGQSLIEYNHRTQSEGIGIAFNDWI